MKLIVSSNNTMHDYLYPEIEILEKRDFYDVYNSEFKETESIDGILIIDEQNVKDYDLLKKYFNKPILGSSRLPKNIQSIVLKKNNINCPKTYSIISKTSSSYKLVGLLKDFGSNDKLVLKANNGAKGIGQIMGKKKDIILLFESDMKSVFNELKEQNKYKILYSEEEHPRISKNHEDSYDEEKYIRKESNSSKFQKMRSGIKCNINEMEFGPVGENDSFSSNYLENILNSKDFLIQEFVENRDEYRFMYYYNQKPLIVKRNKDDDNWQSNACLTSSAILLKEDSNEYQRVYKNMFKKLDDFAKKEKTPFLAFDIYYDKTKKEWGVFEFQMEYACVSTKGLDMFMVKERILKSIQDMFTDYKLKK